MEPDDPTLVDRLRGLKAQESELVGQAELLQRQLGTAAPAITEEKVARFGTVMRQALLSGDPQFRRGYVHLFVDRVEVDDGEIRIRGPKAALSKAVSTGALPAPEELVPSFVREWRPLGEGKCQS